MSVTKPSRYKILDLILQFAPRHYHTTRNPKSKYTCICPVCNYDNGRDTFTIDESEQLWFCFACGDSGNSATLYQKLANPQQGQVAPPRERPLQEIQSFPQATKPLEGASIDQLATLKGLDPQYLRQVLHWEDTEYAGRPAIYIPYYDQNGESPAHRYRVGLSAGDRFRWGAQSQVRPYGLWQLSTIRDSSTCILVEGETDFATLDYAGYNCLGIPGATNFKAEWVPYLLGIQHLYAWQEPDQAGTRFVQKLLEHFPSLKVITPPAGVKDPNELAHLIDDVALFQQQMERLLNDADSRFVLPSPPSVAPAIQLPALPTGTCFSSQGDLRILDKSVGKIIFTYLNKLKKQLVEDYRLSGKHNEADRLEHCWDNYREWYCSLSHDRFMRRYHCGDPVCSICTLWRMDLFFASKGKDKENNMVSKADIIRNCMIEPCVYEIYLYSIQLSDNWSENESCIREQYDRIRKANTHLTVNYGEDYAVASDCCYGIRAKIVGNVMHFHEAILGDYCQASVEMLKEHFQKEIGLAPEVNVDICEGADEAMEVFGRLMAMRIDFDNVKSYQVWRQATKGVKMVQGKGKCYRVSGGKNIKKDQESEALLSSCPICGSCTPTPIEGFYPVATTKVREVVSRVTGRVYLERVRDG